MSEHEKTSGSPPAKLDRAWEREEFRRRFDLILNRPLEVDDIDSFFEKAISSLAELTHDMRTNYRVDQPEQQKTPREEEEQALTYYDLGNANIDGFLTEAERKRQLVLQAIEFAEHIPQSDVVISPPTPTGISIPRGSGEYTPASELKRLHTLLYILLAHDVDLSTIESAEGAVTSYMFRKRGYVTLVIPSINRMVQVCGQQGYDTYMFDLEKIADADLSPAKIDALTKDEKDALVLQHEGIGTSFAQGAKWVFRIEEALYTDPLVAQEPRVAPPRKPKNIGIPEVSKSEIDPWKDFWTETPERHWGFPPAIQEMIRRRVKTKIVKQRLYEVLHDTPEDQLPRKMIRNVGGAEGSALCYEDLMALESIKKLIAIPSVEMAGDWKGFYRLPETGVYLGTIGSITERLRGKAPALKQGAVRYVIGQMVKENAISVTPIRDLKNKPLPGYPYEPVREKMETILNIPQAERNGEWEGFYIDTSKNPHEHYGAIKTVANKLQVTEKMLNRLIKQLGLQKKDIVVRGLQEVKGYNIEILALHPEVIEWAHLREQKIYTSTTEDASKNQWKDFYTDASGNHWGTLHAIVKRLKPRGVSYSAKTIQRRIAATKKGRLLTKNNGPEDSYQFEDVIRIFGIGNE